MTSQFIPSKPPESPPPPPTGFIPSKPPSGVRRLAGALVYAVAGFLAGYAVACVSSGCVRPERVCVDLQAVPAHDGGSAGAGGADRPRAAVSEGGGAP